MSCGVGVVFVFVTCVFGFVFGFVFRCHGCSLFSVSFLLCLFCALTLSFTLDVGLGS